MKIDATAIGARIKKIRGDESIGDFALRLGAHRNTVGNYERGERDPSASFLAALFEAGWNPAWVITGEGSPRSDSNISERSPEYKATLVGRAAAATIEGLRETGMPAHEPEQWHFFTPPPGQNDARLCFQAVNYAGFRIEYLRQLGVMPRDTLLLLQGDDHLAPALRRGDLLVLDRTDKTPPHHLPARLYAVIPSDKHAPISARYCITTEQCIIVARNSAGDPPDDTYSAPHTILGRVAWHARIITP